MRLFLISDTHTEFHPRSKAEWLWNSLPKDVDAIVLAGDIAAGYKKRLKKDIAYLCDLYPEVILVLGNHDHWRSSIKSRNLQLQNLAERYSNFHFLCDTREKIGEHYFIGNTLWFPDSPRMAHAGASRWIDCRYVDGGFHSIVEAHEDSKKFLLENTQPGDIVVSHHIPSYSLVAERWQGNIDNVFFVADCDQVISDNRPAFWFFGHTHEFIHRSLGDTEFICNPLGYPGEACNAGFRRDLIIDTSL